MTLQRLSIFLWGIITATPSMATSFEKATLDLKFKSRLADHGVVFTRLSDGKVLYENNADKLLSPASVTKVVTSAAALTLFGPAYSFKTPLYHTGRMAAGKLQGDLYVVGNGDPFLVSEILWQTAMDLRHLGVKSIAGDIVIDNSLFDDEERDESRKFGAKSSTHAYDAPVSAFAVNFNTVAVAIAPTKSGQPAMIGVSPFAMDHVKLTGRANTVQGDASTGLASSRTNLANGGIGLAVSGQIGENSEIKKIYRSVANPQISAGDHFKGFLRDAGITVTGKVRSSVLPAHAKKIYDIPGYEMRRIAAGLNTFSNNFIADMLTKRLGAAFPSSPNKSPDFPGSGTMVAGVQVLTRFLQQEVGITSAFTLLNGSGLSTENRLTARQINALLVWVERQGEIFPDFLGSLPASGWDGTLKKRMKKAETTIAGMIRAKTGTLTEPITVAGMAGYFRHPSEGWVAFVMITNGREGVAQPGLLEMRNLQDDVLNGLLN